MSCRRVLVVLALLPLAGCGSTTVKTVTVQTRAAAKHAPTKAQFIAEADAICRADKADILPTKEQMKALAALPSETQIRRLPALIRRAEKIEQADLAKLQRLPEPPHDISIIHAWIAANYDKVTDALNLGDAVESGNISAERAATEAGARAEALAKGLSQGYGLTVCTKG